MTTFISHLLCCCVRKRIKDPAYDEESRLIPAATDHSTQSPQTLNSTLVDHQKLQARLGTIVRAKEGKMVNVISQLPFNLHNQSLSHIARLDDPSSSSRSVSAASRSDSRISPRYGFPPNHHRSIHTPHSAHAGLSHSNVPSPSQRSYRRSDRSLSSSSSSSDARARRRSRSSSAGDDHYEGNDGRELEEVRPTPILNLRLVNVDTGVVKGKGRAVSVQSRRGRRRTRGGDTPRVNADDGGDGAGADAADEGGGGDENHQAIGALSDDDPSTLTEALRITLDFGRGNGPSPVVSEEDLTTPQPRSLGAGVGVAVGGGGGRDGEADPEGAGIDIREISPSPPTKPFEIKDVGKLALSWD